ncbi:hypothetical protein [Bacillus atrophaeus]|uniref:hypothetical protein n=1 Tax=Bacillus atrophaeus TaxID=1452 RepID=UPI00077B12B0|nr:hypothetical protein [Bacillus atrophaeus]KXZ16336.1 hypothetical protein AXI57_09110 [Bacillus atrophaeus]MEC5220194.1 hypothetical protein [Bacillus atrophaeus]MED4807328.1 hypothetical protein [Bacillus atrophaeus]MED4849949.1 hypothetical protein [Bacillus atrophaeus]GED03360.1 hypothetical protein BAT02nite_30040 [Bacillus atrophaeus]
MSTFNQDVIVIGKGPAGATAASSGLQGLIIDEKPFPRYRSGKTLHPIIDLESLYVLLNIL